MFQDKILNNILFLHKLLFKFKKRFHHHCVLFATLQIKCHCISSILVILQNDYGVNFNIFFLSIFRFLKSLHKVPILFFVFFNIGNQQQNFQLINHILLLYVKRIWSCLFYWFEIILDKYQNNRTEYQSLQQPEKGKMLKKIESH